ncbi:MAG: aminotransferase class III-fold pyridoxal phosphate-dependent enzyme [Vulcanimicrobiaceae bacterium]
MTADLAAKHRRYVLTPWLPQGKLELPVIVRGEHVYLYDDRGQRYLDSCSGLIAVNLGHGNPAVIEAMHAQAKRLCFSPPNWFNDVRAECAEALAGIAPWPEGARVFFTTGGAQANEDAIKLARSVTGRHKVLTAYRSFHGSSPGAGTLTGENRRWPNEPGMPGVVHFWSPFPYRSPFFTTDPAEETARALLHLADVFNYENPRTIAALVLEPIVGSNGVIVYPEGYLAGVRKLCDEHGVVLIFDEVMTGFGRTGAAFAGERFGVVPDAIVFAKGVTSAYVPLGGVILRESLACTFDDISLPVGHTYSGHPLAMAAALATLQAYRDADLFARAKQLEGWLRPRLEGLRDKHESLGEVRGAGAFFALEFVADRATRAPLIPWQGAGVGVMATLYASLTRHGIYSFGRYNVTLVAPPLVIEEQEVETLVAGLDAAIGELEASRSKT